MKSWNPFGKIDMEVGSFLKVSPFNKQYRKADNMDEAHKESIKANNDSKK